MVKQDLYVVNYHIQLRVLYDCLHKLNQMGDLNVLHPQQGFSTVIVVFPILSLDVVLSFVVVDPFLNGCLQSRYDYLLVPSNYVQEWPFLKLANCVLEILNFVGIPQVGHEHPAPFLKLYALVPDVQNSFP